MLCALLSAVLQLEREKPKPFALDVHCYVHVSIETQPAGITLEYLLVVRGGESQAAPLDAGLRV